MVESTKKTKVIFDFDHTLFSAKKLVEFLKKDFEKIGVPENIFLETYPKAKDSLGYRPKVHFKLLKEKIPKLKLSELEKIYREHIKKAEDCLYPDVLPFLKKIHRDSKLYLVTTGRISIQKPKIGVCGISNFFDKIIITKSTNKVSGLKKIIGKNSVAVFVEDNPEALRLAKEGFPKLVTVRIKRGEGKYSNLEDSSTNYSVSSLDEVEKIILKLEL